MANDEMVFLNETNSNQPDPAKNQTQTTTSESWTILSVEDDEAYQASLNFSLSDITFQNKPLKILNANSRASAATIISRHPEISLILLDVMMEEDDSGLRLINTIREVLGNKTVRIILLTGQPGVTNCTDAMQEYDIDDYWLKSQFSKDHLKTVIYSNLRTWHHLKMMEDAKKGLQLIIEASQNLAQYRSVPEFANYILATLAGLIGASDGGVICAQLTKNHNPADSKVIASSGSFSIGRKQPNAPLGEDVIQKFKAVWNAKSHLFSDNSSTLYFPASEFSDQSYFCLVKSEHELSEHQIYLLQIFSENVQTNFTNIALFNRLSELAYQDPLLGIYNRNRLIRELDVMSNETWQDSQLIICCIDDYPSLQLALGREFLERCISALYLLLTEQLPNAIMATKIAADKLILVLPNSVECDHTNRLTSQALPIDGVEHRVPLRICHVPLRYIQKNDSVQAITTAEHTLELARRNCVNTLVFSPTQGQSTADRVIQLAELRNALANKELTIALQPKIDLKTDELVGFESLARWTKADGSIIPPDVFIPLAEQAGLIDLLDIQIVEKTLAAMLVLNKADINVTIAINVSVQDLENKKYLASLLQQFEATGISKHQIELEITESKAMLQYQALHKLLSELIDEGFSIAIDDFGTGYSSLSHITELPAQTLKIDRSFVSNLVESQKARHIVVMILRLSKRFGFKVVAEGIETDAQRLMLIKYGCHIGQGYLFAKPMALEDAIAWVKKR
jgi:EAL domain-containing protein (putative c-di-GMP-specific phosphodiesterase class I)/PleD family two-component response regulator